jgi:hypothetical protein
MVPLSKLITPGVGLPQLLVVFCTGLSLYALMSSIAPAIMSELFPTELRGVGIGAWYNITVAIFGGTAPLVITSMANAGAIRTCQAMLGVTQPQLSSAPGVVPAPGPRLTTDWAHGRTLGEDLVSLPQQHQL